MLAWGQEPEILGSGNWTAESGYRAGLALVGDPGITAVFSSNDQMALGLMHAFREHGRRLPGDLSVVGFDDVPEAAHSWPPLTTVRQDFPELGRRCVARLLGLIGAPGSDVVPGPDGGADDVRPELVVRSSTTRPPD